MPDPDLEIKGGGRLFRPLDKRRVLGGPGLQKIIFGPLGLSLAQK